MLDACNGDVFNVGGTEPTTHRDLVTLLLDAAGRGSVRHVPWPADMKRIDIGSFYSDSSKFTATTGWTASVTLREGFRRTLDYYHAHFDQYVEPADGRAP
jgi:UDP-glucose 4-epimerase